MFTTRIPKTWILLTALPLLATGSCSDERVSQVAREAADRQAQQNTELARLNKEVASGTHQLVEADAKARQEIVGVHRDLQAERGRLDTNWSQLEAERRQIAVDRRTESTFVSVIRASGLLILVVVVLGFCWYALGGARRGDGADAQLNELLISEILPDQAPLLMGPERTLLGRSPEDRAGS